VPLWTEVTSHPGAPWIRLHFKQAVLGPASVDGKSNYLRLTSLADGDVQVLNAVALEQWGNTSGYFLGDQVLLEVLAQPGAGEIRIVVDQLLVGAAPSGPESLLSICGTDDRVPSTDVRAGRVRFQYRYSSTPCSEETYCTAFLFNGRSNSLLTAGHCCDFLDWICAFKPIVEFNVPPSNPDGSINPAALNDQYPVDRLSIQCQNYDCSSYSLGNDWCYLGVWRNPGTALCPLQAQGSSYTLAPTVPPPDLSTLRVTGYGADPDPGEGGHNYAQQTATGPFQNHAGSLVLHGVDTRGGNSGSAVEHVSTSLVYAIHTHGVCSFGGNKGTAIDRGALLAALAMPQGVCKDCDGDGIPNGYESTGACCMSHSPNDCRYITYCECAAEGIGWYGETGNVSLAMKQYIALESIASWRRPARSKPLDLPTHARLWLGSASRPYRFIFL
jgi:V8-like Glu-specific endopeptidase